MKKVLVILFDKVEEVEAFAPVDILRRAGADVKTAAVGGKLEVCGRSGILAKADSLFSDAAKCDYDAVVLPGGPGTSEIISNQEIADFLSRGDYRQPQMRVAPIGGRCSRRGAHRFFDIARRQPHNFARGWYGGRIRP